MNKHDELIERWVAYRDNEVTDFGPADDFADDMADLLQLYGDALERLGRRDAMSPDDESTERDVRIQYARDTIKVKQGPKYTCSACEQGVPQSEHFCRQNMATIEEGIG